MRALSYLQTLSFSLSWAHKHTHTSIHTHTHTQTHTDTLPPCFPWFPWEPVAKEQRIQGQVCLQMRVPRIVCFHWAHLILQLILLFSDTNRDASSYAVNDLRLNMTHDVICVFACCEFGTSADHAVFACFLLGECVCTTCLAASRTRTDINTDILQYGPWLNRLSWLHSHHKAWTTVYK